MREIDEQGPQETIIGVDPSAKQWLVQGENALSLVSNDIVHVVSNAGTGNGYYTVDTVTPSAGNTLVTVNQAIPLSATGDGVMILPNPYDLITSSDDLSFS